MASVFQERNLLSVCSDDFFFLMWKLEESDLTTSKTMKSPIFHEKSDEESFLEIDVNEPNGEMKFCLYSKVSGRRNFIIIISDKTNSIIYSSVDSLTGADEVHIIDASKLPACALYPVIITCISKDLRSHQNETPIRSLRPVSLSNFEELSSDFKRALDLNILSDTVLNVRGDCMKAHRMILQARSPVFDKMFSNDLLEAAGNEVAIPDIGAETMKRFLNYLYTGTVENCGFEQNLELFYAADKYEVLSLRDICRKELLNLLQPDNACFVFALAVRHSDEDLKLQVARFVSSDFKTVVDSKSFNELDKDDMAILIRLCASTMYSYNRT